MFTYLNDKYGLIIVNGATSQSVTIHGADADFLAECLDDLAQENSMQAHDIMQSLMADYFGHR